jgi:hypothetical protein
VMVSFWADCRTCPKYWGVGLGAKDTDGTCCLCWTVSLRWATCFSSSSILLIRTCQSKFSTRKILLEEPTFSYEPFYIEDPSRKAPSVARISSTGSSENHIAALESQSRMPETQKISIRSTLDCRHLIHATRFGSRSAPTRGRGEADAFGETSIMCLPKGVSVVLRHRLRTEKWGVFFQ